MKMLLKKWPLFFLASLIVLFFCLLFFIKSVPRIIEIRGRKFEAETIFFQKEKGLGGREKLCQDCAMLFVFLSRGEYIFWMKNMNFNLDIIWIDGSRIVHIEKNASRNFPNKKYFGGKADKVLEINAGLADKYGFLEGDEVLFH